MSPGLAALARWSGFVAVASSLAMSPGCAARGGRTSSPDEVDGRDRRGRPEIAFWLDESPGHSYARDDAYHPRIIAFADGRVHYRREEAGAWTWYDLRQTPREVEALRRSLATKLDTGAFCCSPAFHAPAWAIQLVDAEQLERHSLQGVTSCVDASGRPLVGDRVDDSFGPPVPAPRSFVRARERLIAAIDVAHVRGRPKRWQPDTITLHWSLLEPGPGDRKVRVPSNIPAPADLLSSDWGSSNAIDGALDPWVRENVEVDATSPRRTAWSYGGRHWQISVERTHPGEPEIDALQRPPEPERPTWRELNAACRKEIRSFTRCVRAGKAADRRCLDAARVVGRSDRCIDDVFALDDVCGDAVATCGQPRLGIVGV